jgi:lipopolysaccharide export system protein LptA
MNKSISFFLLFSAITLFQYRLSAQSTLPRPSQSSDTVKWVQIQNADKFFFKSTDSATQFQILSGNVRMKQGNTIFKADSVIYNEQTLNLEAFGNIHIKDADSVDIYSQYLLYEGQKKLAHFKDKVKLTDGNSKLYTENMDYDLKSKVGNYTEGGRIESNQTTLTSNKGYYYADVKDIYFLGNVKMSDPEMALATDSLLYNTSSRVSTFIAPTTIKNNESIIQTKEGFYDTRNRKAKFGGRTRIQDSSSVLTSNDFAFDDSTGMGEAKGNVQFIDTAQNILLYSNRIFFNKRKKSFLATEKPVMIIAQNKDSVFIASDTIYSALVEDLHVSDSAYTQKHRFKFKENNQEDSTGAVRIINVKKDSLRFITAFRNVRIYNDSLQAVGDSLFYSGIDSVFELYYNPIAWSKKSQILGDTIFIETINRQPGKMRIFENAILIEEEQEEAGFYNQIKGRVINGFFKEGKIDFVEAKGSAESIYYIKNEDSAYVGMNRSEADLIEVLFDSTALNRIKFTRSVKGITYPIRQIPSEQKKFRNFKWFEAKRPKSKWELFL